MFSFLIFFSRASSKRCREPLDHYSCLLLLLVQEKNNGSDFLRSVWFPLHLPWSKFLAFPNQVRSKERIYLFLEAVIMLAWLKELFSREKYIIFWDRWWLCGLWCQVYPQRYHGCVRTKFPKRYLGGAPWNFGFTFLRANFGIPLRCHSHSLLERVARIDLFPSKLI
jgi:hypothetical protein